jgi:hypothetical protein
MKERYDITCHKLDCAVSEDTNAGFTHWCGAAARSRAGACRLAAARRTHPVACTSPSS